MKIALFSGNYNYVRDGANQALNRLVEHLDGVGAKVRVYSPVTRHPSFEPAGTLVPVRSIPLPGRGEYRVALGLPRSVKADLHHFQPDLIHVSAPDWLGTGAQRFARQLQIPIIASLHTRFETYLGFYGLTWLKKAVERRLQCFYSRSDIILLPTSALVHEFSKKYGQDRVRLWSRGVDRELFSPSRRNVEWRKQHQLIDGEIVLLFFGRLVLEKGVDLFIRTTAALLHAGLPVRPLIVGEGPARQLIEHQLKTAIFTGHLEGEELATAIASADILINPSVTEAFGNVVLEGMASGLPTVASRVASATNLIEDGVSGLLSEPDRVDNFVANTRRLVSEPKLRHALGAAARERSLVFDWEAASGAVEQAYEEALSSRKSAADG